MPQPLLRRAFLLLPALLVALLLRVAASSALASPQIPDSIGFEQRLGAPLPYDVELRDDTGKTLRLGDLTRDRPALLLFGYFRCRKLCGVLRDNVLAALAASRANANRDYELLAFGVDPEETPADAARAKAESISRFPTPGAQAHWRFLTGNANAIERVAHAAGFQFAYDRSRQRLTHPIGVVVSAPPGVIASYMPGLDFDAVKLRDALAAAAARKIATPASPVLLLCFDLDPATGRYTLAVVKLLRIVSVAFLLAGGLALARATARRGAA